MTTEETLLVADMISGAVRRERELLIKSLNEVEEHLRIMSRAKEPVSLTETLRMLAEKISRGT